MKATKPKVPARKSAPKARATGAAPLSPGDEAPSFSLPDDTGKFRSLQDFAGKWLVLYFYPRDATPGCTREACAFRDSSGALKKAGAAVVGVSRDSIQSHTKFKVAQKLDFPLLSDEEARVHKAYGAYGDKMMYGKKITGALRTTVVIAPDGKVARIFRSVKVDGHADAVLAAIREESVGGKKG